MLASLSDPSLTRAEALLYYHSYRHEKYSFGYAGRGGGNAIYINTENNTMTHGPGN